MTKLRDVEYFLLRYVPNVISDEGVLIAAIVIAPNGLEERLCTMNIAADWKIRVLQFDPDSDLEMLEALLTEIRERLSSNERCSDMIHQLEDSFSNVVQVSQRRKRAVGPSSETIEAFARELLERRNVTSPSLPATHDVTCQGAP